MLGPRLSGIYSGVRIALGIGAAIVAVQFGLGLTGSVRPFFRSHQEAHLGRPWVRLPRLPRPPLTISASAPSVLWPVAVELKGVLAHAPVGTVVEILVLRYDSNTWTVETQAPTVGASAGTPLGS